jgi:deferrochelatase/peroxidase EfeB
MRDVRKGFIPLQRNLATDALNEYIQHVGSAVFAVPPGVRDKDDWWGRALFSKEPSKSSKEATPRRPPCSRTI